MMNCGRVLKAEYTSRWVVRSVDGCFDADFPFRAANWRQFAVFTHVAGACPLANDLGHPDIFCCYLGIASEPFLSKHRLSLRCPSCSGLPYLYDFKPCMLVQPRRFLTQCLSIFLEARASSQGATSVPTLRPMATQRHCKRAVECTVHSTSSVTDSERRSSRT
jgi:hypothetical protein